MSDDEIHINIKGPSELKIQISISTDKTVLDLKHAIAEKSDVEADRQRLIYSGRVLKDEEVLSYYKIQSSHTIHMVKGTARPAQAPSSSSTQPAPQIPTMQAGQNPSDPLTLLNSYMGHGLMAGLNPFTAMGVNPNDPNMLQTMMQAPEFMQQMSSLMSNPAIIDQIITMNPQLATMGPQIRELFNSAQFRQMVSNPETLRTMLQMSSAMRGLGSPGATSSAFPAPGVPSTAPGAPGIGSSNPTSSSATTVPGATTAAPTVPSSAVGAGLPDTGLLQALLGAGAFGGGLGGGGLGGGFGGPGGPSGGVGAFGTPPTAAPADTRPPEERFQVQLLQLQEMGFTNAAQNVRAMLATGGNLHAAIEYILNGGGL